MPVLKYWDQTAGAYVQLLVPGQATAYAQVQATAPNSSAPAIAPPNGFLWVDTSTTSAVSNLPYVPPQTPPVSGLNFFTDPAGEAWASRNGSAWKKARDVLHAKVGRAAALGLTAAGVTVPWDTVDNDPMGLYVSGSTGFVIPLAGIYSVILAIGIVPSGSGVGQFGGAQIMRPPGTVVAAGNTHTSMGYGDTPTATTTLKCAVNDIVQGLGSTTPNLSMNVGMMNSWFTLDYLGTG